MKFTLKKGETTFNVGNTLPINFSYKSSNALFYSISSFIFIFLCFIIELTLSKNYNIDSVSNLVIELFPLIFIFGLSFGFLYLAAWSNYTLKIRITKDSVLLNKKFFAIGSTNFMEPLANYLGVEQLESHDSESRYSKCCIHLTHKSDWKKNIILFEGESSLDFNQETEKFAKILNLPIISRNRDKEILLRYPDKLDLTFTEALDPNIKIDNFNISENPYPEKISIEPQDQNLVINIKLYWYPGYIFTFAMILIVSTLIFAAIDDFADISTITKSLLLPTILMLIVVIMCFAREKIVITPISFSNEIYWGNFLIYSKQVQWNQVEDINYTLNNNSILKLSGDQLSHPFAWSLNSNEQKWLRNLITYYLASKSDKLFKDCN